MLAQDYALDLAVICQDWMNGSTSTRPPEEERRLSDVAESFVRAVTTPARVQS